MDNSTQKFRKRKKQDTFKMMIRNKSFVAGSIIVFIVLILALFPGLFAKQDPIELDPTAIFAPPSSDHLFGTDNYGRDIYSRVIYATKIDLQLGVFGVSIPFVIGTILGLLTGYYG